MHVYLQRRKIWIQEILSRFTFTLAERLKEAYKTVEEHNRAGRGKQKVQYDKNTKLVKFSVGDYIYLKEMAIGPGKSKKFRGRWRGPFEITKRLSDWNYQIRMKPGKDVNVNRMKLCRNPPTRKRTTGRLISGSKIKLTDSGSEPRRLVCREGRGDRGEGGRARARIRYRHGTVTVYIYIYIIP
jgi:hypothetical protein